MMEPFHVYGQEWQYDESCDCPYCTDWRDSHCPRCGAFHIWHGRDEAQRRCVECRYAETELYEGNDYKPGPNSDLAF